MSFPGFVNKGKKDTRPKTITLAQYKRSSCRQELSADLSKRIFFCGLVNLMLMPVIFCWTFIFTFFNYFGVIRREPGKFK